MTTVTTVPLALAAPDYDCITRWARGRGWRAQLGENGTIYLQAMNADRSVETVELSEVLAHAR